MYLIGLVVQFCIFIIFSRSFVSIWLYLILGLLLLYLIQAVYLASNNPIKELPKIVKTSILLFFIDKGMKIICFYLFFWVIKRIFFFFWKVIKEFMYFWNFLKGIVKFFNISLIFSQIKNNWSKLYSINMTLIIV